MRSALDSFSVGYDYDLIGSAHGREAVSDDQSRPAGRELSQYLLYLAFALIVERARGFVKDEYFGVFEENSCDAQTLFLTS